MTDKVQKIREEIKKLHGNPYYMMAVKDALAIIDSLQEEPVSDDLNKFAEEWDESLYRSDAVIAGAKWHKQQMMAKAIDGDITFDYYGDDDKTYGCIAHDSFCLEDFGLKDRDKVKVIVIKED